MVPCTLNFVFDWDGAKRIAWLETFGVKEGCLQILGSLGLSCLETDWQGLMQSLVASSRAWTVALQLQDVHALQPC